MRYAIIAYKHVIYELPHEFLSNLRLRNFGDQETSRKCVNTIEWLLVILSVKMQVFLMLGENSWKTGMRIFPNYVILHKN